VKKGLIEMSAQPKISIENRVLSGCGDGILLQRIATAYIGGNEYRVFAPSSATGNSIEWLDNATVHVPSPDGFGGELLASHDDGQIVIGFVREKLEALQRADKLYSGDRLYYHVRFQFLHDANIEMKFDLMRPDLEERILEPYRQLHSIVVSGRTIMIQELKRIEVFESSKPSSQFEPMTTMLAKQAIDDWFAGESSLKNVTDQFITTPNVGELPQKTDAIELLCSRFNEVSKQLRKRRENRPTLDVADEYDVQDLLHALLRIFFDDVRSEEWTPSYAGKSSRMDFLLPKEQTVVEAKKARPGLGTKEIGDELIIDIARYKAHSACKKLVCFVYDPDSRITNPHGIESDLSGKHGDLEVKVMIAPQG
jgi:hypothetical protein